MPRHLPAVLALVAMLLVPSAADAKGIARLSVCGPGGCVDRTRVALHVVEYPEQLLEGGMPVSDSAVTAEPFVRLRLAIGDGTRDSEVFGHYTVTLLPRAGHLQMEDGSWGKLQGSGLRAFRRVARGVERFPAAKLGLADLPEPVATTATPKTTKAAATTGTTSRPWLVGGIAAVLGCAAAGLAFRRRRV